VELVAEVAVLEQQAIVQEHLTALEVGVMGLQAQLAEQ
jgi:hypothetical protein